MRTLISLGAGLVALGLLAACDSSEPMAPANLPVHFTGVPSEPMAPAKLPVHFTGVPDDCPRAAKTAELQSGEASTFQRVEVDPGHPVDRNGDGVICRKVVGGERRKLGTVTVVEVDNIIAGAPEQY